jgi:hypothetical protein
MLGEVNTPGENWDGGARTSVMGLARGAGGSALDIGIVVGDGEGTNGGASCEVCGSERILVNSVLDETVWMVC